MADTKARTTDADVSAKGAAADRQQEAAEAQAHSPSARQGRAEWRGPLRGRSEDNDGPPVGLNADERERYAELKGKKPNPDVPPADTRTEDEEHEFRDLAKKLSDYERHRAMEKEVRVRMSPEQRLDELKGKGELGEGETIERRRIEELMANEKRIAELKKKDDRTVDDDAEIMRLQRSVSEAREAGGFDANG